MPLVFGPTYSGREAESSSRATPASLFSPAVTERDHMKENFVLFSLALKLWLIWLKSQLVFNLTLKLKMAI